MKGEGGGIGFPKPFSLTRAWFAEKDAYKIGKRK